MLGFQTQLRSSKVRTGMMIDGSESKAEPCVVLGDLSLNSQEFITKSMSLLEVTALDRHRVLRLGFI